MAFRPGVDGGADSLTEAHPISVVAFGWSPEGTIFYITRSRLSIAFLTGSAKLKGLAVIPPSVLHPNMVEGNRNYLSKVLS